MAASQRRSEAHGPAGGSRRRTWSALAAPTTPQHNPDRPGSVTGMAQDPVAVAASNNPLLTTLTSALSGKLNPNVNLVDTLNGSEFTVFAPTDAAFAKIDPATIDKLKTDSDLLTSILTYHVVPGPGQPRAGDGHAQDGAGR